MATRAGQKYRVPDKAPSGKDINDAFTRISNDVFRKTFLKADLPTDNSLRWAFVSDEAGGATLAFWDGTDWRRVQDRAVVS
jgi:hypothetical protein